MDIKRFVKLVIFLLLVGLQIHDISCQAQIIEGLKDAVLNAESVVRDVFKSLDSVAKHLKFSKEFLQDAVEEDCKFVCRDGTPPKKNKYHKPSSNGCGVPGIEIKDSNLLLSNDMTKCCDHHDICYGTCNKDKDDCDLAFKKCLYALCDSSKDKNSETFLTGCRASAKALFSGTLLFGCKFYKSAQEQACYCPPPRKFPGDEL